MSIDKQVSGVIVLPCSSGNKNVTVLEISPDCRRDEDGRYFVDSADHLESILEIPSDLSEGGEGLIFTIRGLHTGLRRGESVRVNYTTDANSVHWASGYEIFDGSCDDILYKF